MQLSVDSTTFFPHDAWMNIEMKGSLCMLFSLLCSIFVLLFYLGFKMYSYPSDILRIFTWPRVQICSTLFHLIGQTGFLLHFMSFIGSGFVVYIGKPLICDFLPQDLLEFGTNHCYDSGLMPATIDLTCGLIGSSGNIWYYKVKTLFTFFSCLFTILMLTLFFPVHHCFLPWTFSNCKVGSMALWTFRKWIYFWLDTKFYG